MEDIKIKIGNFDQILMNHFIKIDIGCGPNKKDGCIGIDRIDLPGVDIVADLENGLKFLPDNSIDEIYTSHFLEHIENFELMMHEMHRVLKPSGKAFIRVPHFSNPYYYSDYTHKRFFGYYTFYCFTDDQSATERKSPNFYNNIRFRILDQSFVFSNFIFRIKWLKILANKFFNCSIKMQEFYERTLSGIFPCTEIFTILTPVK